MAQLWLAGMEWSESIACTRSNRRVGETWKISTTSVLSKSSRNWARIGRPGIETERFQNTPPRLRDIKRLLPQSRSQVNNDQSWKNMNMKWMETSVPAVPHSRSGKKWIWNECRTSAPAFPQSRSGKNEYEMSIVLVLPQSRSGKNEYRNLQGRI